MQHDTTHHSQRHNRVLTNPLRLIHKKSPRSSTKGIALLSYQGAGGYCAAPQNQCTKPRPHGGIFALPRSLSHPFSTSQKNSPTSPDCTPANHTASTTTDLHDLLRSAHPPGSPGVERGRHTRHTLCCGQPRSRAGSPFRNQVRSQHNTRSIRRYYGCSSFVGTAAGACLARRVLGVDRCSAPSAFRSGSGARKTAASEKTSPATCAATALFFTVVMPPVVVSVVVIVVAPPAGANACTILSKNTKNRSLP